ncbi:YcjF family protein [Vibrio sp.]|nr:YcjF family protein [Vibrio sp.]
MSEFKEKQTFDKNLEQDTVAEEDLTLKRHFDNSADFQADELSSVEEQTESLNIEPIIRPKKQRWMGAAALTVFGGLVAWQGVDSLVTAYQESDWLTLGWSGFISGLAGFGLVKLGKEWLTLRKLKQHFSTQEKAEQILREDGVGLAEPFCRNLIQSSVEQSSVDVWQSKLDPAYNDKEVFELYDAIVLKHQDKRAIDVISRYSANSAVMVAISPLAIADMLLVAWRSLKMLEEIADIYQIELGYWSRLRLLKLVLANMAFAGVTELAIDTGMDIISTNLVQKLSARAGQGVGVGLMTGRLGVQAMKLMRPLPWMNEQQASLGTIKKSILTRVLKLSNKS